MNTDAGSQRPTRQLRNLLINPRFQLKYLAWIFFSGLAVLVANAWIFYAYVHKNYSVLVELAPMTEDIRTQLFKELQQVVFAVSIASCVFLLVVCIMALVFSHKIAGPLYHFRISFEKIRAGKVTERVHLRPKDEFQEVALAFNEMMDSLRVSKEP